MSNNNSGIALSHKQLDTMRRIARKYDFRCINDHLMCSTCEKLATIDGGSCKSAHLSRHRDPQFLNVKLFDKDDYVLFIGALTLEDAWNLFDMNNM